MESRPKIKFQVYRCRLTDDGYGNKTQSREMIGETCAVSEKKAISNIRYRMKMTGAAPDAQKGSVYDTYEAIPA